MKNIFVVLFALISTNLSAQNQISFPDTLSGTTFNFIVHTDSVQFLPGMKTLTNAYNQYSYLGPTLLLNQGDQVTMNVSNTLSDTTTVHWHGLHVPAMADGGPHTVINPGNSWSPMFTVMNHAAMYWYHPHLHMKTGQQAMRGAAGLIIVRDSVESSLNLPRQYGIDDFPLIIQSQQFDSQNQIEWRGMHDSILIVNGTTNPALNVPSQVVRMRLLNASQERNFNFGFTSSKTFYVIGNDGGLLNAPVLVNRIRLSPGERAEILVDFSSMNGQTSYLMSYASEFGQGVQGGVPMPGMDTAMYSPINGIDFNILLLNIGAMTTNPISSIPTSLVSVTPLLASQANITRIINITAQNIISMDGPFFFNGNLFDMNRIDFTIPLNNIEIWSLRNQTMVAHPFHIHDVQFFVLDRDGVAPSPEESGFKDVVMISPMETLNFITKFEDFTDSMPYMYHCHILMHEDDGMMGQFRVVASTSGITNTNSKNNLSVFPNPAGDFISIKLNSNTNFDNHIKIFNISGQIIYSTLSKENELVVSLKEIQSGVYFIQVIDINGNIYNSKFVKE